MADSDYGSQVVVQGFDADQVDALASLVISKLEASRTYLAGPGFRLGCSIAILILLSLIGLLNTVIVYLTWKNLWPARNPWVSAMLSLAMPLRILCSSNLSNWLIPILPGFVIYSGQTSFMRRNKAEIGFIGLIVSVMGLVIPFLKKPKFRTKARNRGGSSKRGVIAADHPEPSAIGQSGELSEYTLLVMH